jgi:hypothetical protein
MESRA